MMNYIGVVQNIWLGQFHMHGYETWTM